MRLPSLAILACAAAGLLSADSVTLRNGQTFQGTFIGGTARQIRLDVNGEVQTFDVSQVRSVTFSEQSDQSDFPSQRPTLSRRSADPSQDRYDPPVSASSDNVIPANTMITIRMIDSVNSDTTRIGQTFMASLEDSIVVNGRTLVPRGADVMTKLVDDQNAGRLQGRTVLSLALVSIKASGQWVDLSSTDVRTESQSQGAKSAKVVGGTAALGAIIGGIVGGGKGAAIGAGSGAVVGTGAAVMTNGEKVVIPSETRLTFRLQTAAQL